MMRLEEADVLTDFDRTMVREQTPYIEAILYLAHNPNFKKISGLFKKFIKYKQKKDARYFYSFFEGCPVEVLDRTLEFIHPNEDWERLVEREGIEKVGIVSRNSVRIISEYVEQFHPKYISPELIVANIPEIKDGIYTGKVDLQVELRNLARVIKKKPYICGKEERKALEDAGMYCKSTKGEVYICEDTRLF
jgi:hypothetical protein